ncbi:IclR family transcriptional regulator [Actinomycetes bacterium M1A6_2h]
MGDTGRQATPGVGVLQRAFAIVDAVELHPMTISDLARTVELPMTTVHRLAHDLTEFGVLRRAEDGVYSIGHRFRSLGIAEAATPVLRELSERTDESVQVWVHRGDYRLCVASVDSSHEIRAIMPVGTMLQMPGGSGGRVLAGQHPSLDEFGWVVSLSERIEGLGSISAPVKVNRETVAAVCLSGPVYRIGPDPGAKFGEQVKEAARKIEGALTA